MTCPQLIDPLREVGRAVGGPLMERFGIADRFFELGGNFVSPTRLVRLADRVSVYEATIRTANDIADQQRMKK